MNLPVNRAPRHTRAPRHFENRLILKPVANVTQFSRQRIDDDLKVVTQVNVAKGINLVPSSDSGQVARFEKATEFNRLGKKNRATSMVLYGDLAYAVRREAACAVMYWWGVGASTVNIWRRTLGVPNRNEGDRRLIVARNKSPSGRAAIQAMRATLHDPARAAKIAAAKSGKPRPAHLMDALRKANIGRKLRAEHRRKIGAAHKRRGTMPPAAKGPAWQPWEDELVRALRPAEVAQRTGRTLQAVFVRRSRLRLPDGRTRAARRKTGRLN
jgi:hypothetical protein